MNHKIFIHSKKVFIALSAVLALVSCSGNDDSVPETNISLSDSALAAKSDGIFEATQHIVESGYNYIEEPGRMPNSIFGASCPSFEVTVDGTQVTLIVDFGPSCQLLSGPEVSGQIVLEYGPRVGGFRTIDYVYQDFFFNGNQITGGGQIIRESENSNGNPQSSLIENITVAFVGSSVTANRVGTRIVEWVEGVGSGTWIDNVYYIWGEWETTLSTGFTRTGVVNATSPLVRGLALCDWIVSGVMEITQENLSGTLDFGDGTCDSIAIFTVNGIEFTINLD
jgi:hypothetical protein